MSFTYSNEALENNESHAQSSAGPRALRMGDDFQLKRLIEIA